MGGRPRAKSDKKNWMAKSYSARMRTSSSFHEKEKKMPNITVSKWKAAERAELANQVPVEDVKSNEHDPFAYHLTRDAFPDIFD
jgi:hypothetical protein